MNDIAGCVQFARELRVALGADHRIGMQRAALIRSGEIADLAITDLDPQSVADHGNAHCPAFLKNAKPADERQSPANPRAFFQHRHLATTTTRKLGKRKRDQLFSDDAEARTGVAPGCYRAGTNRDRPRTSRSACGLA